MQAATFPGCRQISRTRASPPTEPDPESPPDSPVKLSRFRLCRYLACTPHQPAKAAERGKKINHAEMISCVAGLTGVALIGMHKPCDSNADNIQPNHGRGKNAHRRNIWSWSED